MTVDVSMTDILNLVAAQTGMTAERLKGSSRARPLVRYRQIFMFLARAHTRKSFPAIARFLNGRDHTTVLHGVRSITVLRETDAVIDELINDLTVKVAALPKRTVSDPTPTIAAVPKPVSFSIKRRSKDEPKFVIRPCLDSDCRKSFQSFHVGERFCPQCSKLRKRQSGIDPRYEGAAI